MWTFWYIFRFYVYVYDHVCICMLPGQKCWWQDWIIPFLRKKNTHLIQQWVQASTSHRHGLFPLRSLLSSKQVPQRLQYLLMAAWFPWTQRASYGVLQHVIQRGRGLVGRKCHCMSIFIYIYIYAQRLGSAQALQRRGFPFTNKWRCKLP